MSDDSDLTRIFAQSAAPADDDTFVAGVARRIANRRRLALAIPACAAALLLFAVWGTWPEAYAFSATALSGLMFLVQETDAFFTSQTGMLVAAVLLLTAAAWAWLFERTRGLKT